MTFPKRWNAGERITAERLNADQSEALRHRRTVNVGNGSSLVNETLGNQSGNMIRSSVRLVFAVEDFGVTRSSTDLAYDVLDNSYSGACRMMRMNIFTGDYQEEVIADTFRVYDVIATLTDGPPKVAGDIFYAVNNHDSHRWEVFSASADMRLVEAIVLSCIGDGWHEVLIVTWAGSPPAWPSASASVDDACNLCVVIPASQSADALDCEVVEEVISERIDYTLTNVIAYVHTTNLRPMLVGGMIRMIKSSSPGGVGSLSGSASASGSASIDDRLYYKLVDGVWPLVSLPFPIYDCCVDPLTGAKNVQITSCIKVIVEGVICDGGTDPCPTSRSV